MRNWIGVTTLLVAAVSIGCGDGLTAPAPVGGDPAGTESPVVATPAQPPPAPDTPIQPITSPSPDTCSDRNDTSFWPSLPSIMVFNNCDMEKRYEFEHWYVPSSVFTTNQVLLETDVVVIPAKSYGWLKVTSPITECSQLDLYVGRPTGAVVDPIYAFLGTLGPTCEPVVPPVPPVVPPVEPPSDPPSDPPSPPPPPVLDCREAVVNRTGFSANGWYVFNFTVLSGNHEITLVTYTQMTEDRLPQKKFDFATQTFGPGIHTVSVPHEQYGWQADALCGSFAPDILTRFNETEFEKNVILMGYTFAENPYYVILP